jgi:hypothetical protein
MSDHNSARRRVRFRDLNWLGKSVFVGGALARLTETLVDATTDRVTTIARDSKRAFNRELDPNMEEACVLEEIPERSAPDR